MDHPARHSRVSRRTILGSSAASLAALSLPRIATAQERKLDATSQKWGTMPDGSSVELFTLTNGVIEVKVTSFGATMTTVKTPDRDGKLDIVTLYLDTFEDYLKGHPLFGSTVGRFANRIGGAKFSIDGKEYNVTKNSGQHHIHGGNKEAFAKVNWKGEPTKDDHSVGVSFTHTSLDGEAGFPGTVQVKSAYQLSKDNLLTLTYHAQTDKPTHVNLTNHVYWNLAGAGSGDVLGHQLTLHANQYLQTDAAKIPTGKILPVDGPMDFRTPKAVGATIKEAEGQNYDHCYVLEEPRGENRARETALLFDPKTGRELTVQTTQPGVQLYTARGLNDRLKGGGKPYGPYHGLCLETQHFPDAPNKPAFPTTLLRPGEKLFHSTWYRFGVRM